MRLGDPVFIKLINFKTLIRAVCVSVIFAAIIFNSFCSKKISENEPQNNIRKQALRLEPGQKLTGSYYSTNGLDIDYVYTEVTKPAMIKGHLSAVKGVDSEIQFFRKGEAMPFKTVNDNKSSLDERFGPFLIDEPGVVIAIRPVQPVNDHKYANLNYDFSFELFSPPEPVEQESNDTFEEANAITEGGVINGYYNNALNGNDLEKDFFYLDLPEEKKYRVSANVRGVAGVDSILRMYSQDEEKLYVADDSGPGEPENIFSQGVQGPARIYFSVSAKDYKISESEYYQLKVTADPYEEKYELEPNDSISDATPIKVDKIFGDFSSGQDTDYYKFSNEKLETVNLSVELVPTSRYDIKLEFYPSRNAVPVVFNDGNEEASEGIATWSVKPLETVYLKISAKTMHAAAYVLNTEISSLPENQESEPNDSLKKATDLYPGKTMTAYMNPKTDRDYFKFKIPGQDKYDIRLESLSECTMEIAILDVRGNKTEGKVAGKPGEEIAFSTILDANGYALVTCENMSRPAYTSQYRLSIEKSE